jgi:thymidylate synthase (FAD)
MSAEEHTITENTTLKDITGVAFTVLDKGFVRLIDVMGSDNAIVQAARVSYGAGTKTVNDDKALINYLVKHKHTSPLEMCEVKFHLKMPIFVARQWMRHRTASINEYSARYSVLSDEFYLPELSRIQKQSKDNKQGSGEALPKEMAEKVRNIIKTDAEQCYKNYDFLLSDDVNFARELARMNLNLNYYTEFYWKIDLHNFLHFLNLRCHPHAQYEIRVYAEKMLEIAKVWCPFAVEAFENFIMNAKTFSKTQIEVLKRMVNGEKMTHELSGLSKRDWAELEIFTK